MVLSTHSPSARLRAFIRNYVFRDATVPDGVIVRPLRARADPFLAFHLGDPLEAFEFHTGAARLLPPALVVGPQTTRLANLHLRGRMRTLFISFQPAGFHRLFSCDMTAVTDRPFAASELIGEIAGRLHQRLCDLTTVERMIETVESELVARAAVAAPAHPLDRAAALAVSTRGRAPIAKLIAMSGLSERQFERKFVERIGVTPKRYSRILRFNHAIALKEHSPGLTWSAISCEAGYFDQTHLVKDFKAFAGDGPSNFMRSLAAVRDVFPTSP